jgi:hypothetical protein
MRTLLCLKDQNSKKEARLPSTKTKPMPLL